MPECKKCQSKFPNRILKDGVYHNLCKRKYCLKCSPFKQHNTKNLVRVDNPNKTCAVCRKGYTFKPDTGCTLTHCIACYCNLRRFKLKQKAVDYKGGKCERCGYNRCFAALDFHHIDPQSKSYTVGDAYNRSWKKLKIEIDKYILLCSNCHREEHYKWAVRESNSQLEGVNFP